MRIFVATMKITLIQMDVAWGAVSANLRRAEALITAHAGADLYVLSEMFATGFTSEPEGSEPERVASWLRETAQRTGAAVAGSTPIYNKEGWHNRLLFVKPDGSVAAYDKRHLFCMGGEGRQYVAGEGRTVVEWRGVRFLLQVCFDLRFPCFARYRGDYDAVLYVASWPAARREVWDVLLRARAIENQCYALGVNRVGRDPSCVYNGGTQIVDALGHVMALAPDNEEAALTATVDVEALSRFRRRFPVLECRD